MDSTVHAPAGSQSSPCAAQVQFDAPDAAITPQQACVLFCGDVVLGSALVRFPVQSLMEAREAAGVLASSPALRLDLNARLAQAQVQIQGLACHGHEERVLRMPQEATC